MNNKKEWTIKDISEVCGVSKPTVQNTIKELQISYDKKKKNKHIFYSEKVRIILKTINNDLDFNEIFKDEELRNITEVSEQEEPKKIEKQSENIEKESQKIAKEMENIAKKVENIEKERKEEIFFLRRQIEAKDELIKEQGEQIKNLLAKNDSLLIANLNLQKNLLIEQREPTEAEEGEAEEGKEAEKVSFLRKLFGRK